MISHFIFPQSPSWIVDPVCVSPTENFSFGLTFFTTDITAVGGHLDHIFPDDFSTWKDFCVGTF